MRRFLLASVAASGLMLASLPAFAQLPTTTPPIADAAPAAEIGAHERAGVTAQTPDSQAGIVPPRATTEGAVTAQAPGATAQTAPRATVQAAPRAAAQADTRAPVVAPHAQAQAGVSTHAPAVAPNAQAQAGGNTSVQSAAVAPANAGQVCQTRTTSVHFGGGSALSRENGNAIEQATDAASVCSLQNVVIASTGSDRTAQRRAASIRALLVRQGVPEDKISVEEAAADANSGTGQADIRMNFAGTASAQTGATLEPTAMRGANAAAGATTTVAANAGQQRLAPPVAPRPAITPAPAPRAPTAMPAPAPSAAPAAPDAPAMTPDAEPAEAPAPAPR